MRFFMDNKIFFERLNQVISESNLTLTELSDRAGVPLNTLRRIVKEKALPSTRTLLKLRRVINFKFDYLLQFGEYEIQ